jgi:hypothetical protein
LCKHYNPFITGIKYYTQTLTLCSNDGNLEKGGSTFNGWNLSADGSGTHYDEGALYTTNVSAVLFAEWV